jgi:hypothetical protein
MEEKKLEEAVEIEEDGLPRVMVKPHQLGGIGVVVRGADGTVAEGRINVNEAALIAAHLQALITMAFGTAYNAAAAEEEALRSSRLVVPGR